MDQKQVEELLVGIARANAALVLGVAKVLPQETHSRLVAEATLALNTIGGAGAHRSPGPTTFSQLPALLSARALQETQQPPREPLATYVAQEVGRLLGKP